MRTKHVSTRTREGSLVARAHSRSEFERVNARAYQVTDWPSMNVLMVRTKSGLNVTNVADFS